MRYKPATIAFSIFAIGALLWVAWRAANLNEQEEQIKAVHPPMTAVAGYSSPGAMPDRSVPPGSSLRREDEDPEKIYARRRALFQQIADDPQIASTLKFNPVSPDLTFNEEELMRFGIQKLKTELQSELNKYLAGIYEHDQSSLELISSTADTKVYYLPKNPDAQAAWDALRGGMTEKLGNANLGSLMTEQLKRTFNGMTAAFEVESNRAIIVKHIPDKTSSGGDLWELQIGVISAAAGYSREKMLADQSPGIIRANLHSTSSRVMAEPPAYLKYLFEDQK